MNRFPYKPIPAGTLKEAAARLIQACGGSVQASDIARVGQSQLDRYRSTRDEDAAVHMPADVIRSLENEAVRRGCYPIVTEFLAAEAGAVLLHLPPGAAGGIWNAESAALAKECAEAFGALAAALADDGAIDEREAGRVVKELDDMLAKAAAIRRRAAAIRDGESGP